MWVLFNLRTINRDGSLLVVSRSTKYEQWVRSPQLGWKEFNKWEDLSGLAACLGTTERKLVKFLKKRIKIPDESLPEKYRGRA